MPVLVDHEKTRDRIAELACGIVAQEGLHALTMRRIAAEAAMLLQRICSLAGHRFMSDSVSLADAHVQVGQLALSSSDVTDAHLILLARESAATFVTFDRAAAQMAASIKVPSVLLSM